MNRYQAMMETLPAPAGQAERLRTAVLARKPKRRRAFRPLGKKALLAAVLAAGLLVTAGAALEAVEWDPVFLERFGASSVPGAAGIFRDVNAVSICGDVTLTVRQAIGDKENLYVLLDYQLPEEADLEAIEDAEHLPPFQIDTLRGMEIAWEDIQDKTAETLRQEYRYTADVSSQSTHTTGFDPEKRTLTCLLCAAFQEGWGLKTLLDPSITLLVWPPEVETEDGDLLLADQAAVVSFRPSFDADILSGKSKSDGITYTAEVSPLSFQVRMKGDALPDMTDSAISQEIENSVALRFQDGRTVPLEDLQLPGGSSSAGASFTHHDDGRLSGKITLNVVFRELIDPAGVEAVLVGDVEIPVS